MTDFYQIGRNTPQQRPLDFGGTIQKGLDVFERFQEKETARKEKRFKEYKDTMAFNPYISLSEVANERTNRSLKAFEEKYAPIWYDMDYDQRMEAEKEKQKIFYENEVVKSNDQIAKGLMGEMQKPNSPYDKIKIQTALDEYKKEGDGSTLENALDFARVNVRAKYAQDKRTSKLLKKKRVGNSYVEERAAMNEDEAREVIWEDALANPGFMKDYTARFFEMPEKDQKVYFEEAEFPSTDLNSDGTIDEKDGAIVSFIKDQWKDVAQWREVPIEDRPRVVSTKKGAYGDVSSPIKPLKDTRKYRDTEYSNFYKLSATDKTTPQQTLSIKSYRTVQSKNPEANFKDQKVGDTAIKGEVLGVDFDKGEIAIKVTKNVIEGSSVVIKDDIIAVPIETHKDILGDKYFNIDGKSLTVSDIYRQEKKTKRKFN